MLCNDDGLCADLSGSSSQLNGGLTYCIALYDYEATCPEELSFGEGEVLRVLRKAVHEELDDGWWEGMAPGGRVGLFPSLVVEECREDGEPLTPEVLVCIQQLVFTELIILLLSWLHVSASSYSSFLFRSFLWVLFQLNYCGLPIALSLGLSTANTCQQTIPSPNLQP